MIIHYINHNFTDWDSQTKHMSRIEKSIFLDLRTMYFGNAKKSNGNIDGSDFDLLCYRLSCKTEEEITALKLLLKDQFTKVGKVYRNADWDRQIKNLDWWYQNNGNTGNEIGNGGNAQGNESGNAMSNAERQAKAKQERKNIVAALSSINIEFDKKAPIATLRALFSNNFGNGEIASVVTQIAEHGNTGNESGNEIGNGGNAEIRANNHKPITNNQEPLTKNKYVNEVAEVFEFWKATFGKMATTKLSDERKRKIIARLKDGYTVEQIKQAIANCSQNEFNIAGGHTDIELICRDVKHLERYMELKPQSSNSQSKQNQSRFGTKDDPLAVDVVWNQPVAPVSQMTYEEWEAEEKAKQAARESVKTKGFEVIE